MTKEELKALRDDYKQAPMNFKIGSTIIGILNHLISEAEKPVERWRAENGGVYWHVGNAADVWYMADARSFADNKRFDCGNYYRTKEEAQTAAERVRKAYVVE